VKPHALLLIFFALIWVISCGTHFERVDTARSEYIRYLIKFHCRAAEKIIHGRITYRTRNSQSVIYFFNPLNQVVARLYAIGEETLLIAAGKKGCWRGNFRDLIDYYWGIPLELRELLDLIERGEVPTNFDAIVDIKYLDQGGFKTPFRVLLRREDISLTISIENKISEYDLFPLPPLNRCSRSVSLPEIFEHD